jgi:hypothetical protein
MRRKNKRASSEKKKAGFDGQVTEIILDRNWRRGRQLIHAGRYRVPLDMTEAVARQAIDKGGARIPGAFAPVCPEDEVDGGPDDCTSEAETDGAAVTDEGGGKPPAGRSARRAKRGAPENKDAAQADDPNPTLV